MTEDLLNQRLSKWFRPRRRGAPTVEQQLESRRAWWTNRRRLETQFLRSGIYGTRERHRPMLDATVVALKWTLKALGLYRQGVRNAENIVLRQRDLLLANLPPAFDGFTILHLSDLHFDGMPGLEHRALDIWGDREVDLCVLTGDYRHHLHGPRETAMESLRTLVAGIRSRHGFLAVLGNHDDSHMVQPIESMGVRMLINESAWIHRRGQRLRVTGTDDVRYYYTEQADRALEGAHSDFSIALVHSPEFYDVAHRMGVDLYLCGHTHAGQICLPGGRPLITHVDCGREFYKGVWNYGGMYGVTHSGVGTSGIPVRFHTQGELLLLRLRRGEQPA